MLTFSFELAAEPDTGTQSSYAMGYMSVLGPQGGVDSRTIEPAKQMMIFLSIVDLLDGLRRLIATPDWDTYQLIGTDSSFSVLFEKIEKDVRVSANGSIISQCPAGQVASAVLRGVDLFLASAQPDEPAFSDLTQARADFKVMLKEIEQ
jgi:hypothetical protein